jgi:transposase
MEAGVGSHFLGRALREQGHEVRLMPAQFVRPFVKSNKNDYRDLERGIGFAKGPASLRRQMPEILENADERLTARMRRLLDFLWQEWKHLQLQIESLSEDLEKIANSDAACVRLQQIPGVGRWWRQP